MGLGSILPTAFLPILSKKIQKLVFNPPYLFHFRQLIFLKEIQDKNVARYQYRV